MLKIVKIYTRIQSILKQFGLDTHKAIVSLLELPRFVKTLVAYKRMAANSDFPLTLKDLRPMLTDRNAPAGHYNPIYFFQDIWAAKKIYQHKPERHVDVGSSIEGFVAHLLCFMPVEIIDIRPLQIRITGLSIVQEDATTLSRFEDNSLISISTLHAIEHFGLGRYGDSLTFDSYERAMKALARVLKPGGRLYFSVPIGRQRVQFNSQRIFNPLTILKIFSELKLLSFSAVNDNDEFIENVQPADFVGLNCGCGMFEFTK